MKKKLLSIVIPAFNEELNIPLIYKKLSKILGKIGVIVKSVWLKGLNFTM